MELAFALITAVVVVAALLTELRFFARAREPERGEAVMWSLGWLLLAVGVAGALLLRRGLPRLPRLRRGGRPVCQPGAATAPAPDPDDRRLQRIPAARPPRWAPARHPAAADGGRHRRRRHRLRRRFDPRGAGRHTRPGGDLDRERVRADRPRCPARARRPPRASLPQPRAHDRADRRLRRAADPRRGPGAPERRRLARRHRHPAGPAGSSPRSWPTASIRRIPSRTRRAAPRCPPALTGAPSTAR